LHTYTIGGERLQDRWQKGKKKVAREKEMITDNKDMILLENPSPPLREPTL
jgi:hypothetical protein